MTRAVAIAGISLIKKTHLLWFIVSGFFKNNYFLIIN
jgi:hypothetical protein